MQGGGRGWSLMIFHARATRGRGLPSLDARSRRSLSPHPLREDGFRSTSVILEPPGYGLGTSRSLQIF